MKSGRCLISTMQQEPQITYRGMEHSAALDLRIREHIAKLDEHHARITSCHVIIDELDRHKRKGNLFDVRVDVRVPGKKEIVASNQEHEDPYIALNAAFDAVYRQLDDDTQKRRGEVKTHREERGDDSRP